MLFPKKIKTMISENASVIVKNQDAKKNIVIAISVANNVAKHANVLAVTTSRVNRRMKARSQSS